MTTSAPSTGFSFSMGASPPAESTSTTEQWTQEPNQRLFYGLACFVSAVAVLRILTSPIYLFLVGPVLYLYLVQTCPSEASFDAKQQIKRVLRGHHLPEDHPDKPRGVFGQALARVTATVTTELATGLGYQQTTYDLQWAVRIVWLRVPAAQMDFYWVGAVSRWTYVYSAEIPPADTNKMD